MFNRNHMVKRRKRILNKLSFKSCSVINLNSSIKVLAVPHIFEGKYYKFVVTVFQITRLWPFIHPNQSSLKKLLPRVLYYTLTMTIIIPEILRAVRGGGDRYDRFLAYITTFYLGLSLTKYTAILLNRLPVKVIFDEIVNDWETIRNEKEREFLVRYANLGYSYRTFYIVFISAAYVFIVTPQFLLFTAEIFFNVKNSTKLRTVTAPGYYVVDLGRVGDIIHCFHYSFIIFANLFIQTSTDIFLLMCTSHISGLFEILSYKLNQCGCNKVDAKIKSSISTDYSYLLKELRQLAIFHTAILKHVSRLENTFSYSFLIVEILCLAMLPLALFIGYGIEKYPIFSSQLLTFFVGFMLQLYFLNAVGQRLIDESGKISNSIYCSNWYTLPVECRRFLGLIMLRSIRPSKITSGKISTLSLPAFLKITKTIFSWYTVLISVL